MKKNTLSIVTSLLAISIVLGMFAGCSGGENSGTQTPADTVPVQSSETDDVDARLDSLARQVELALLPMDDITVGPAWQAELGIVRECSLQSVKMSGDEQAAAPIASQTLEFVVEWEDHIAPVVPGEGLDCAIEIRPKEAP